MVFVLALVLLAVLSGCSRSQQDNTAAVDEQIKASHKAEKKANGQHADPNAEQQLLRIIPNANLGIDFVHDAGFSDNYSIYEPLGSGVATLDSNDDGWWDLFFPQYGRTRGGSRLYLNHNGKSFTDYSNEAGVNKITGLVFAAAADYNNDGQQDLLAGGENQLTLLANQGQSRFADSNRIMAPVGEQFFSGASWFDADKDGWLDVWVSNYVDGARPVECRQASGRLGYCSPSAYPDRADLFLHNQAGKAFVPFAGIQPPPRASLGVVAADFDRNGWPDVYVANDGEANQLYFNHQGRFGADEALRRGAGLNLMGEAEASMGVAVGDIDSNGFPDLYLTHYRGETNTIYMNQQGHFMDKTARHGLAAAVRPMTGFGTVFTDLNGDNRLDIVAVNGSVVTVEEDPDHTNGRLHAEPVQIWLNTPEGFELQKELVASIPEKIGRGLIAVDWDNDGDKDLVISNNNQSPTFLQNQHNPGNWLGLDLRCHKRAAIGALAHVESGTAPSWYRRVHTDGSYASSQDPRLVFYGLKGTDKLVIEWPSGRKQTLEAATLKNKAYQRIHCPADSADSLAASA